jgi:hypothetical protein
MIVRSFFRSVVCSVFRPVFARCRSARRNIAGDAPFAEMIAAPITTEKRPDPLIAEIFLMAAGPALVKRAADVLAVRGIPVMPLKGVLLQRLVYRDRSFRPIIDVDLLVPDDRFFEACSLLREAGFTKASWELGRWQVTLRNPDGPPLGIDLHRRITRTVRSRLTEADLFARGRPDAQMFGGPVILPSPDDLLAHLLLHATLH